MDEKWMFELSLFDGEVRDHEYGMEYTLRTKFEITDLSEKLDAPPNAYGRRKGIDWSTVDNPMKLYWLVDRNGDNRSFSFRKRWDGTSTGILRSLNWNIFPQVILNVHKIKKASHGRHGYRHLIPVVNFVFQPAEFRFVRSEPFIGGERFGLRFTSLRSEFF